ncbi:MAG: S-methyl-5-thioribose-1-phosphate isomerase [Elusimicrobia bacterium]|nr:MAG: S-methyl-5-thioribose-1-phosphate isomerase [Elusimicrobiota bacterium]
MRRKGAVVEVLDQLALPGRIVYRRCDSAEKMATLIRTMVLRGAPLIGVAAAYGYALAAKKSSSPLALKRAAARLLATRPTAVNLRWGLERMSRAAQRYKGPRLFENLMREADAIRKEDIAANARMAAFGAKLIKKNSTIITHCNAGYLATAGVGTAVGVVRHAFRRGKIKMVYADETRPYLQGSRLTMWELMQDKIPCALLTDGMAAHIMKTEKIDAVFVGADRIAANADTANKIGTYGLAIAARAHKVPFYVVAPASTFDMRIKNGDAIPIEERSITEVLNIAGHSIAPRGADARHPAFDVTPARLITAIVTDRGIVKPANRRQVKAVLRRTA